MSNIHHHSHQGCFLKTCLLLLLLLSTLQQCSSFTTTNSHTTISTEQTTLHRNHKHHHRSKRHSRHSSDRVILSPSQETRNKIQNDILSLRAGAGGMALGSGIDLFFRTFPYTAAFITCGIKASAADLIAQKKESGKKKVTNDVSSSSTGGASTMAASIVETKRSRGGGIFNFQLKRNFAFIMYGGLYQGMFQEFVYNNIFPILFGHSTQFRTVLSKVMFDLLVLTPFLCLPIAYIIKGAMFQKRPIAALIQYMGDVKENGLLTKFWSLWCPVQFVTFGIIPEHFRISFIACISFFWLIILSAILEKSS